MTSVIDLCLQLHSSTSRYGPLTSTRLGNSTILSTQKIIPRVHRDPGDVVGILRLGWSEYFLGITSIVRVKRPLKYGETAPDGYSTVHYMYLINIVYM